MTLTPAHLYVGSYLLGSIPTGYWLGKLWKGVDVRQFGSGNLGATNVFRVLGKGPGAATLAFDIFKGFLAVFIAKRFFPEPLAVSVIAGVCAILGHATSVFVRFRGGKGVATSAGVFLALLPVPSAAALITFVIVFGLSHYVSLGSMSGALVLSGSSFLLSSPPLLSWTATVIAVFVVWTHRANIQRLLRGTENRIEWKRKTS